MEEQIQFLTKQKLEEVLQVGKVDAGSGTLFGVRTQSQPRKNGLTLVISTGGSGMSAIKTALQTANWKLTPDFSNYVKFIVVDSSTSEIAEAKKQGVDILNISSPGAAERIQKRNTFYKQFVPANYDVTLLNMDGSSQNRMTGKIKLYDANSGMTNVEVLREMIENLFMNEWKALIDLPVDIMILTGISGGTGSGTFLDLAAQARRACPVISDVRVFGYIMLPDTAERYANSSTAKNSLYRNCFAALKELESYMSIDLEADREEYFPSQFKANEVIISKITRLYDYPVLISGDYDEAVSMIAETIVNSIADSGGEFEQRAFYSNNLVMRATAMSKLEMLDAGVLKPDACPEDSHLYCGIGYAQASIPEKIVIPNIISRINRKMYVKQEILGVEGARSAAFCTTERRLDRVDFERQMRVLLNLDDRVKLDENSLCNKVIAILRAKGKLGQNNSELSRQDIVAGRTAEYIRNFNVDKTVTKAVPLFIEEIEKLYLDLERQARLVMNLYGPRAIEYLYEGKGNDNEKGVPEDYSDICLKRQIEVVASALAKFAGMPGRYPRNLEQKGLLGNIVQSITKSDEDEWKDRAQQAAQAGVYCQICTKMIGMNGGWKKSYEDRVVRFKDCTVRFAQVFEMLMNYYTDVGSSLDSTDYREFANTSGDPNGVNLCSDSSVYNWVVDCVERKVNSVDIGAAKTALVTDFYENTEDWVSADPGKARKAFDDVMSRIASIGKYSVATGGLDLTITDYFNEVLKDIDPTQQAVKIDKTVNDIMKRLLQSSAPSLAMKRGKIGHINKVILVPRKLMIGSHRPDIEKAFRKYLSDYDTMAVSTVVDSIVCYQASVANALSNLKDLELWENGYEDVQSAIGTTHLHNGEYITLHMDSGRSQYSELTKSETDFFRRVKGSSGELLSMDEEIIYGTGLSWKNYPSVNLRRYGNDFTTDIATSEGRYRREIFDKKIDEALRLGIIECEETAENVYKYFINLIPSDWNNLDVQKYKQVEDGRFVRGIRLFYYLSEQNTYSNAPFRKQIMLYNSEPFGSSGFDFNEIIRREHWDHMVIERTHRDYMKRIMRKATGLYQELEDTLYKFYDIEKNLSSREIYELLVRIDNGYAPTDTDKQRIKSVKHIQWHNIQKLPYCIGLLSNISSLNISGNVIENFSAISSLKQLCSLDLSCTNIENLSEISSLENIVYLDLSGCENLKDINALSSMTSLTSLVLNGLHIAKIPENLIDLGLNFIFSDPLYKTIPGIYIHGLTLDDQPIEIFHQGREAIIAYLESQKSGSSPVNECKVVFLGDGGAGKTLMIDRLMHDGKKSEEFTGESTPGIYISSKKYWIDGEKIKLHFWDFGGQEIMHSMHRLFLTNRTLYVVVANARDNKANGQAWYWIRNIKSFANGAPILLVVNQKDQCPGVSINWNGLVNEYPVLKDVKIISALNDTPDEFNREIRDTVCRIVSEMDSVHTPFARAWLSLMNNLQNMKDDYITSDIFYGMCRNNGIETSNRVLDEVINWYQDLGVCFYSRKNPASEQYMVLKPRWLLNALYILVFNGRLYATNGVISEKDIYKLILTSEPDVKVRKVWEDIKYVPLQVQYIIDVLLNFELIYRLEKGKHQGREYFFIPMLCDENEPKTIGDYESDEEAFHVSYRYTYLPENILHRLMVRCGDELNLEMVWRTGAAFERTSCHWKALVRIKDNNLDIYVKAGNQEIYPANTYLEMIRESVKEINQLYGLTANEFISYRRNGIEDSFNYKMLTGTKEHGGHEVFSIEFDRMIPIDEILGLVRGSKDSMTQDVIEVILSALADMSNRSGDFESKGEEEITRDVEAAIKQILNDRYQIQIAREYTMGRAKKKIGETDLYFYRHEKGKLENLYILENKNMHTFDFKKQYGQLIGYLNPEFTAGITISINKKLEWEAAFDKIESKLRELKDEGEDFVPININRKMTVNRTQYIKSEHIVPETRKPMTIYHLVLQISDQARQEAARKARQR